MFWLEDEWRLWTVADKNYRDWTRSGEAWNRYEEYHKDWKRVSPADGRGLIGKSFGTAIIDECHDNGKWREGDGH